MASLARGPSRCPLLHEAMLKLLSVRAAPDVQDFPHVLVSEAASAFDVQLAGLELLQASALKSAAEAGIEGKAALATLTTYFDSRAARYILKGDIAITIDPLPMALGVLPRIPLALHLWFRSHCPTQAALTPPILLAAQAVNLVGSGTTPQLSRPRRLLRGPHPRSKHQGTLR